MHFPLRGEHDQLRDWQIAKIFLLISFTRLSELRLSTRALKTLLPKKCSVSSTSQIFFYCLLLSNFFFHTDNVSNYVIPKAQLLQRCFISISLNNLKIIGFPIRIDNKSYIRNAFYFNLCFAFNPMTRTFGHEPIIRKCAEYLVSSLTDNRTAADSW